MLACEFTFLKYVVNLVEFRICLYALPCSFDSNGAQEAVSEETEREHPFICHLPMEQFLPC